MVQSILNKTINYIETDKLAKDDENYPTIGYEMEFDDQPVTLALGQAKYTFSNKKIIYFPIYLILDDVVNSRIGVYEIYNSQLSQQNIFDEDGDVDPSKLGKPLYFSYLTDLLKTLNNNTALEEEQLDTEIDKILISDSSKPTETAKSLSEPEVELEVEPSIEEKYISSQSKFWIQKFLKDNNYKIKDNEGGGECLFAALRDAYQTIKKDYSVSQLREIIASKATEAQLKNYKELYNATFAPIDKLKKNRALLIVENKQVMKTFQLSKDRDEQQRLKLRNQELVKQATSMKTQISELEEDLVEFDYLKDLKDIVTLDQFKEYIKSCNFWGESWAVSILEQFLKIKLILLSPTEYSKAISEEKSFDKVLFCGDIIHPQIQQKKVFIPVAYIILDYDGSHFKLITYKNLGIFTFAQLPTKIKALMKKCQLIGEGSYHLIPELKEYEIPVLLGGKKN